MPAVLIRQCRLKVVRRGGWSWGPQPRQWAGRLARAVAQQLDRRFADLVSDEEELEITEPIRLRLVVRRAELEAFCQSGGPPAQRAPGGFSLEQKLAAELDRALQAIGSPAPPSGPANIDGRSASEPSIPQKRRSRIAPPRAVIQLLIAWERLGCIEHCLASMSLRRLEQWYLALTAPAAHAATSNSNVEESIVEGHLVQLAASLTAPLRLPALALRLATEAIMRFNLSGPLIRRVVDRALGTRTQAEEVRETAADPAIRAAGPVAPPERLPSDSASPSVRQLTGLALGAAPAVIDARPHAWEVRVDSAVPFLLLGPLSRLGYLEALSAVLEAAGLEAHAYVFAVALAYKALDAPIRGWRRAPQALRTAAAFAGLPEPVGDDQVVELSRRIGLQSRALDRLLAQSLLAGHPPGRPFVLHWAQPAGFLLTDSAGGFPLALSDDVNGLFLAGGLPEGSALIVSDQAATPPVLAELDANRIPFVTRAAPVRGERWRPVATASPQRAWTNSSQASPAVLAAVNELYPRLAQTCELIQRFVIERPAVIRSPSAPLERSVTLAASVALASIAWDLWSDREPTGASLVLERYRQFEARVRFSGDLLSIELPLGRRQLELRAAGFLDPIEDVPWLPGCRLTFS